MPDGDDDGGADVPPAARRFLTTAAAGRFAGGSSRAAQDLLDRLDKKESESGDSDEDPDVSEQRAAADGSETDTPNEPEIGESEDMHREPLIGHAMPDVPAPRAQLRPPRARGVRHPPVPTQVQVDRHKLEQHVNYAAWSKRCAKASALMK